MLAIRQLRGRILGARLNGAVERRSVFGRHQIVLSPVLEPVEERGESQGWGRKVQPRWMREESVVAP
jgi:hypothetical protein